MGTVLIWGATALILSPLAVLGWFIAAVGWEVCHGRLPYPGRGVE